MTLSATHVRGTRTTSTVAAHMKNLSAQVLTKPAVSVMEGKMSRNFAPIINNGWTKQATNVRGIRKCTTINTVVNMETRQWNCVALAVAER